MMTLLMATVVGYAADKTVYLKPDAFWLQNSARFAVYMFNDSGSETAWADFTAVEGEENIYQATVPEQYANIVACQMSGDPSSQENIWDNRSHQTQDIKGVKDQAIITITTKDTDSGYYSSHEVGTYVKSVKLMGSFDGWTNGLTLSTQLPSSIVQNWEHSWYAWFDLKLNFEPQQLKLLLNDKLWLGFGEIELKADALDLLSDAGGNDHNFLLDNQYRDYEVLVECDKYYQELTLSLVTMTHERRPSAITEVKLVLQPGETEQEQEWSIPMERQGDDPNTFSYAGTLDLTKYTQNPYLALRVKTADGGNYLLNSDVALSESSIKGLKKEVDEEDNTTTNLLLTHLTTGYSTYTLTATWNSEKSWSYEGWTLDVQGKERRKYYIVGELTGGWPEDENDESKDREMKEVDWFDADYRIGEVLYYNYFVGKGGETYEYKLRTNKVWGLCDVPAEGNLSWNCPEDGVYSLEFQAIVRDDTNDDAYEAFEAESSVRIRNPRNALNSVSFVFDEADVDDDEPEELTLTKTPLTRTDAKIEYTGYIDVAGFNKDYNLNLKINDTALGNPNANVIHCYSNTAGLIEGTADGFRLMHAQFCHINKRYKVTISWDTTSKDIMKGWTVVIDPFEMYDQTHFEGTFVNGESWDEVYAYTWSVDADGQPDEGSLQLGAWPGTKLEKKSVKTEQGLEFDVYGFEKETELGFPSYIIFNNGKENKETGFQTDDLEFVNFNEYTVTMPVGTYIWTSNEPQYFDAENRLTIASEKFANAKVGDKIHVYLSDQMTSQDNVHNQWVALYDNDYTEARMLEGAVYTASTGVIPTVKEAVFTITGDILSYLKHGSLSVRSTSSTGHGCKTRVVTLETVGTEAAGSIGSVWAGTPSQHVVVSTAHFKNANGFAGIKVGDVIRVTTTTYSPGTISVKYQQVDQPATAFAEGSFTQNTDGGRWVDVKVESDAAVEILNKSFAQYPNIYNILFDITEGNITQIEIAPSTGYYVVSNRENNVWKSYGKMELDADGDYALNINNEASGSLKDKYFAIAPSTALDDEGNLVTWNGVIRPNRDGNFAVNYFYNYAGRVTTENKNQVWLVSNDNEAELVLEYYPSDNSFAITSLATETVSISAELGYATYSHSAPYQFKDGANGNCPDIYIVKEVDTTVKLFKMRDDLFFMPGGVGKGAGVILHKAGGGTYTVQPASVPFFVDLDNNATTLAESQASFAEHNLLAGSGSTSYNVVTDFADYANSNVYILANGSNGFGFYEVDYEQGSVLAPHKAFLAVPKSSNASVFISFEEMTTGINPTPTLPEGEGVYYDLSGRRVEKPAKGIYIVNGKKVVIK